MKFTINGQPATGVQAELHYMSWCLALENEHNPVPRTALAACNDFQHGAFNAEHGAGQRIRQAGITVTHKEQS